MTILIFDGTNQMCISRW